MTYYTSTVSPHGNICYSNVSQEEADAKALELDMNNCTYCTDCEDCTDCTNCSDCTDCESCRRCKDCIQSNSVSD